MGRQWPGVAEAATGAATDGWSVGAAHQPLRQAVHDALRAAIIEGAYAPGERLVEEEIAARFDVSRNPIREALHALSVEGFVVIEPRRGARVATVDAARARDLFELRGPLEGLVARLAALRRTPAQVERLRALVREGIAAGAEGRIEDLPHLNTEFHALLAEAAGNALLAQTLARLSDIIRWVYAARIGLRWDESWREHAAIVDAVAAGDAARAYDCGLDHIARASAAYSA